LSVSEAIREKNSSGIANMGEDEEGFDVSVL
jgi:hypothetical protein